MTNDHMANATLHQLPITNYQLPITNYQLPITTDVENEMHQLIVP